MSYRLHHAIIVTATYDVDISLDRASRRGDGLHWADHAQRKACELFRGVAPVSEVVAAELNGVRSFFIGPDGSSEGWPESDAADRAREEYIGWLRVQSYGINEDDEYEGSPLSWVVVSYGEEEFRPPRVLADSDEDGRR